MASISVPNTRLSDGETFLRQTEPIAKQEVAIPLSQKLVVGAIAGVIGTCCIYPIDVVKTRLQNQSPGPDGKLLYRGVIHCFRQIVAAEGFAGLYKGLGANLVGVTPEKALKLGVNDFLREKLTLPNGELPLWRQILAGGGAGFAQVAATNPMEIVKLRMQLQNLKPVAERQTTMQVLHELGFSGLYRGVAVTWIRDVPYSILFFPGYALLKDMFSDEHGHAGVAQVLSAGGIAGAAAAGLCTPADVIKTRFQAETQPGTVAYTSIYECFSRTVRDEGYMSLFKGCGPRMSVTAPLFGISLLAFELQKRFLKGEKIL